jgi:hypothetical protein
LNNSTVSVISKLWRFSLSFLDSRIGEFFARKCPSNYGLNGRFRGSISKAGAPVTDCQFGRLHDRTWLLAGARIGEINARKLTLKYRIERLLWTRQIENL